MFFGENEAALPAAFSAFAGSMIIFFVVMLYISRFLNRLKNLSPADAIHTGIVSDSSSNLRYFKLRKQRILTTDLFLGANLILTRKKTYFTFVLILIIASFVMVLPANIYSSISSDRFIAYMGVGNADAMIVLPGGDSLNDLNARLNSDKDLEHFVVYDNKSYEFMLDDNTVSKMWVTLGDQDTFPVLYTQGNAPGNEGEAALSHLNAVALDKMIGDTLSLIVDGQKKDLIITGIYSDITNGGKTARMTFSDDKTPSLSVSIVLNFKQGVSAGEKLKSFEKVFPNAKIYHIETYRDAVFGSTLNSVKISAITAMILSLSLIFLITLLFVNMLIVKDRRNISIQKSIGFTSGSLCRQYMTGSLLLVLFSMMAGVLLVGSVGESIAARFIETMGIANFQFDTDKRFVLFIAPLSMLMTVFIGTDLSARSIHGMNISDYIRG